MLCNRARRVEQHTCRPPKKNVSVRNSRCTGFEGGRETLKLATSSRNLKPPAKIPPHRKKPHLDRKKSDPQFVTFEPVRPEKHSSRFLRSVIAITFALLVCRQNLSAHSKSPQSALMKLTSSDTAQTSFWIGSKKAPAKSAKQRAENLHGFGPFLNHSIVMMAVKRLIVSVLVVVSLV